MDTAGSVSVIDILTIPGEVLAKFQPSFHRDPVDAVFKAMGCSSAGD